MSLLIIHPKDHTTSFLDRVKNHLTLKNAGKVKVFNIQFNEDSHKSCLKAIGEYSETNCILFLGHGRTDSLYGSRAKYYQELVSADAKLEYPEKYFGKEKFIDESTVKVFNKKKVFCLSCNSNDKIGKLAFENGAKVFVGFGNIPTSIDELEEQGEKNDVGIQLSRVEQAIKTEVNYITKRSLEIGMDKNLTFYQLVDLIAFITSQRITYYLIERKNFNERRIVANHLFNFKNEIVIYGNGNLNLIG